MSTALAVGIVAAAVSLAALGLMWIVTKQALERRHDDDQDQN